MLTGALALPGYLGHRARMAAMAPAAEGAEELAAAEAAAAH